MVRPVDNSSVDSTQPLPPERDLSKKAKGLTPTASQVLKETYSSHRQQPFNYTQETSGQRHLDDLIPRR